MRIVLQDRRSGHYLQETGGWTEYVDRARDFACSADAMNARQTFQVADATLVFRFEREGYSIGVPLEPIRTELTEGNVKERRISRDRVEQSL